MTSHPQRRLPRRGRSLPPAPVEALIAADPQLRAIDDLLRADGYVRQESTRPYIAKDGLITLRFVWRRRSDGRCAKHEEIQRIGVTNFAQAQPVTPRAATDIAIVSRETSIGCE